LVCLRLCRTGTPVGHPCGTGQGGHHGPEERDEPAGEDGYPTTATQEVLRIAQTGLVAGQDP
jgi:hypothetical protein